MTRAHAFDLFFGTLIFAASRRFASCAVFALVMLGGVHSALADVTVFSTNFDTAIPTELVPGTATLTGVQGFAGLGPTGNQFGGSFLRSATGNIVTLALSGLPTHDLISLDFFFAAID